VVFLKPSLKTEPSAIEKFDLDGITLYWKHEGELVSIPMIDIQFIEFLSKTSASVVTRKGVILTPSNFYFRKTNNVNWRDTIKGRYPFFNPITQDWEEREKSFKLSEIARIEFDAEVGDVKRCPVDDRFFPAEYGFCPFDQVPLLWGSLEEDGRPLSFVCTKCDHQYFGGRSKYCSFDGTELISERRLGPNPPMDKRDKQLLEDER